MNESAVLLSRLAVDQLRNLSPAIGRSMVMALTRLVRFPESAQTVSISGYEAYRQIVVKEYRAVYQYFPDAQQVRVYCILHTRRQLPPAEFLMYQLF